VSVTFVVVLTTTYDVGYFIGYLLGLLILPIVAMMITAGILTMRGRPALRFGKALTQRLTLVIGAVVFLLVLISRIAR